MFPNRLLIAAIALLSALALAGTAQVSDGTWSRAFGANVSSVQPFTQHATARALRLRIVT